MAKLKYTDNFPLLAEGFARDGLTDEQIAKNLDISVQTYYDYQKKYPEFLEAIKRGKAPVDIEVENLLLEQCRSGNLGAIIFWLKNRMRDKWRDRQDVKHSGDIEDPVVINISTTSKKFGMGE